MRFGWRWQRDSRWNELVSVQAKDLRKDGVLVVLQPKTGRAKYIPLPPDLVREIRGRVGRLVPFDETSKSSSHVP